MRREKPYDELGRDHAQAHLALGDAHRHGDEQLYRAADRAEEAFRVEKVRRWMGRER